VSRLFTREEGGLADGFLTAPNSRRAEGVRGACVDSSETQRGGKRRARREPLQPLLQRNLRRHRRVCRLRERKRRQTEESDTDTVSWHE
jgi:hypothetical protein